MVLNEVQQRLFVDRYSQPERAREQRATSKGSPLVRYKDTGRYIRSLDILRQADIDDAKLEGSSIAQGLTLYRKLLEDKCYLDYTAIMEHALRVLGEDEGGSARLAARVRHVIVDEYQDVNPLQEKPSSKRSRTSARTSASSATTTRPSTNGTAPTCATSSPSRRATPACGRCGWRRTSARAAPSSRSRGTSSRRTQRRLAEGDEAPPTRSPRGGRRLATRIRRPRRRGRVHRAHHQVAARQCLHRGATTRGLAWSDVAILIRSGLAQERRRS